MILKNNRVFERICEVTDYKGNHCSDRSVNRIVFKGKECFLCERCYKNHLNGAYD